MTLLLRGGWQGGGMAGVGDLSWRGDDLDRPRDARLADLAARQHGPVSHAQLLGLGFSRDEIYGHGRRGRLHRLYPGVYAVGHPLLDKHGRWLAAVLACGPGALLSHRDAAELWELRRGNRRTVDVTAARSRRGLAGITLHRPRRLDPDDGAVREGIPVTSVARTLLDCAAVESPARLERLVEEAELRGVFDLTAVDALLARSPGRGGVGRLRRAVAGARPFVPFTRSELERMLPLLCREAALPQPAMNVWVAGNEVDALFSEERVVVEIDGTVVHGTRQARRRDPQRDAALQIAGYRVLRVTEEWLRRDPAGVVRTLRAMLEASWAA